MSTSQRTSSGQRPSNGQSPSKKVEPSPSKENLKFQDISTLRKHLKEGWYPLSIEKFSFHRKDELVDTFIVIWKTEVVEVYNFREVIDLAKSLVSETKKNSQAKQ